MKKILFIAGTRPEAIKLAPVYLEMSGGNRFQPVLCATGQHTDLFTEALDGFGIKPDIQLNTMTAGQSLSALTGGLFSEISRVCAEIKPGAVIVQGDTMSAFSGGWTAFLGKIPVLHVEAGLRTGDRNNPFPEEANRRAISLIASYHAAATSSAMETLVREGIPAENIRVTGNTAIDALYRVRDGLAEGNTSHGRDTVRRILATCHRRENIGAGLQGICAGIRQIAIDFPDVQISWVSHPNPAVTETPRKMLEGLQNVKILQPMGYRDFVRRMQESYFLISDSGGIQEEAPALGKPVLVTRHVTERPEAEALGATRLVGTDPAVIREAAASLLNDKTIYNRMATAGSPYGDGHASEKICAFLMEKLEMESGETAVRQ